MGLAYSKLPEDAFKKIGINAGVLLSEFDISTGAVDQSKIIGATTGNVTFNANPTFEDFGENINNCPKNTKELMRLTDWEIKLSGTLVTCDTPASKRLIGLCDADSQNQNHLIPRSTVDILNDFGDIWFVFDYSDVNTGNSPGKYVIHMMDCMSTGGFQVQTGDKEKAQWSFEFTAHYSIDAEDDVPFEVYVIAGTT